MQNIFRRWFSILLAVVFIASFTALFITQNWGQKPPGGGPNVNVGLPGSKPGDSKPRVPGTGGALKKFASLAELREFLAAHAAEASSVGLFSQKEALSRGVAAPQQFAADGFGGGGDYSRTNVQVQGVDEADIVKSDGTYLYIVSNNNVFIVEAYPAQQAKVLAKIQFKSQPQNIYIGNNRLVVFGYDSVIYEKPVLKRSIVPGSQFTFFKVFDISDRKNPKQLRDLDFEGSYLNSRMIGDYVYLITAKYSYHILEDDPMPLPRIIESGERIINDPKAPGYRFPNVYYFDIDYDGYNLTSVSAINIADSGSPVTSDTYTLDYAQQLYVSPSNMYLTYTKRARPEQVIFDAAKDLILPRLSQRDRDRIAEIEKVPAYILSLAEKFAKIARIIERYQQMLTEEETKVLTTQLEQRVKERYNQIMKQLERTVIHKIAIEKGKLSYQGAGEVQGFVLNQYSMDEDGDYFRIATTRSRQWLPVDFVASDVRDESYSNLYILDKNLKVVGSVENLAPGERIFSVRFMQHRAYLVTFKQIDPLFVVDLADPKNPKVLGQLKVPGFSNYLHPYDDTTVIGLGKDTAENEFGGVTTKGLKISLFDVSDVANPKEAAKYVVDDPSSNSIALNDPKAFLFSREKNLLVIPVSSRDQRIVPLPVEPFFSPEESVQPRSVLPPPKYFNGAYVFSITKNAIELKGKISHESARNTPYSYYYGEGVRRSMYIKDALYTVSTTAVKANRLSDLADITTVDLIKESSDDFTIMNPTPQ